MKQIHEDVWLLGYPLKILGLDVRRNVTVVRLSGGALVIHSSAPFALEDIASISKLGEPKWLLDAMLDHDSFAPQGREAFPEIAYLAPSGFESKVDFPVRELLPAPEEWGEELLVSKLEGAPSFGEHAVFHTRSRTLIVCDLLMNFPRSSSLWTSLLLTLGIGRKRSPGVSRRLRHAIKDREAFKRSLQQVLEWDFDRIIVGHGEPVLEDAREKATEAFRRVGLL